jgi:hypothetical protein
MPEFLPPGKKSEGPSFSHERDYEAERRAREADEYREKHPGERWLAFMAVLTGKASLSEEVVAWLKGCMVSGPQLRELQEGLRHQVLLPESYRAEGGIIGFPSRFLRDVYLPLVHHRRSEPAVPANAVTGGASAGGLRRKRSGENLTLEDLAKLQAAQAAGSQLGSGDSTHGTGHGSARAVAHAGIPGTAAAAGEPPFARDPEAYQGIELVPVVRDEVPQGAFAKSEHKIAIGIYWMVPHFRNHQEPRLVYFVAYNQRAGRAEWVVGPDDMERFRSQLEFLMIVAGNFYGFASEPSRYAVDTAQIGHLVMKGDLKGAIRTLGKSWMAALRDPNWYLQAIPATAGGLLAQAARREVGAAAGTAVAATNSSANAAEAAAASSTEAVVVENAAAKGAQTSTGAASAPGGAGAKVTPDPSKSQAAVAEAAVSHEAAAGGTQVAEDAAQLEARFRAQAEALEQADGGHSLVRHGPGVADADLEARIKTGYAPPDAAGNRAFSPAPSSTRFRSHRDWVETRDAALKGIEKTQGIDLTQPPGPGQLQRHVLVVEHSRPIDEGFLGVKGSEVKVPHPNTAKPTRVYGKTHPVTGITRTLTQVEWNGHKWMVVQHFPSTYDWDPVTGTYTKPAPYVAP